MFWPPEKASGSTIRAGMGWNKASPQIVIHERSFGESGKGPGQFRLPRHICALPDGNLCISDSVNQRLQIVNSEGVFQYSIGEPGSGTGQLRGPCGVACEGGHLFVVEGGNHRVQKLALADGAPLGKAGSHGSKNNGELWCPHGVTIAKGSAYVADYINGRVVVYDISNMEHLRTFGERGKKEGQLEYPCGIAVKGDEVYVAEFGNHRISVFNHKTREFQRCLGSEGKGPGQFYQPRGLAFVKGWLLVTEAKRVTVMSPTDGEVQQIVELPGAGQLWGVCKDVGDTSKDAAGTAKDTRAYVTDIRAGHARIFVLNVVGNQFDDGNSGGNARGGNADASKQAEAAAKLLEWKKARAESGKKDAE